MRRFETEDRFWEIEREGAVVRTRSGKRGSDGRAAAPKRLASPEKAEAEVEKRIAEQLGKGYLEVGGLAPEPSNPELERQILEDPLDPGRCLVYADWLQGQGHPRGELGVIQSARAARPKDAALAKAEQQLFVQHPALAPTRLVEAVQAAEAARKQGKSKSKGKGKGKGEPAEDAPSVTWENGFIAAARLARGSRTSHTVRALVAELLAHPAARFLRELRIGGLGPDEHDYDEVIEALIRGCPATLRTLSLVDLPAGDPALVFANLADVTPLLAAMPLLEELRLAGPRIELRALSLPKLRRLAVATNDREVLLALAKAELPALESLELSAGDAELPAAALAQVLAAPWPVRRVALTRTANTDELVPYVVRSKLLPQLAALDLSGGKLSDAGAGVLVAGQAKLAHLASLDVSGNTLSATAVRQLSGVCAEVRADDQRAAPAGTISESDLRRMSPDAGALAKGRALANPKQWPTLGRADNVYWGECRGSDVYEVFVEVPSLENGCSCPSGKRPCKHTIGLAILVASGHAFPARPEPSGLRRRATAERYYAFGE